jgi:hypothetical protein
MAMAVKHEEPKAAVPLSMPADFPMGSVASRAAARALLEERDRCRFKLCMRVVGATAVAPPRIRRLEGGMAFIYGPGCEDHDPECTEIYRGVVLPAT